MQIFQKSIIQKHLANFDQLDAIFKKFKNIYNFDKIQLIKTLKEEEYQDGFLRDIFVNVFDYTLKPEENFNLVREFKNQTDGKKADGAILQDDKAIAIIELKSYKTKDLTTVTQQAFNYKNNQPKCKYVITSNFQKLRFYIDYANEYEEFDLFNLDKEAFALLYLILHKDNLLNDLPLQMKQETKCHEENISTQFYQNYSQFKQAIFTDLTASNPQFDQLVLFKKSQKFLDRLLFVLFAEDTGLLTPNSIAIEVENWQKLQELNEYKPLYHRLHKFFGYLNKGHQHIPAYNGGLFAADKILDKLVISDKVLQIGLLKLSGYDFNTELDVNILGHIFEHSLTELEEMEAEIAGNSTGKNSKRKKDGIFYTPKYITQYIVENTLGKLCIEKRQELGLIDVEFDSPFYRKDGKLSVKGDKLFKALDKYKKWLFTLKILDPACGSGAFLNQALSFLIAEHKFISDLLANLTETPLELNIEKIILEKNIFGVDINEESVEIAQLSLWLRTAKKGRKLSNLSRNIKCGNSLIDDVSVAGEKAFNWAEEFPKIIEKGGFDVVIGNPPYVRPHNLKDKIKVFLWKEYSTASQKSDLYSFFLEKSINLLKEKGMISFIVPKTWMNTFSFKKLRKYILESTNPTNFGLVEKSVFKDATVETIILVLQSVKIPDKHNISSIFDLQKNENLESIPTKYFCEPNFSFFTKVNPITKKLDKIKSKMGNKFTIKVGIVSGNDGKFVKKSKESDIDRLYLKGGDIKRYYLDWSGNYIHYDREQMILDGNLKPKSSLKQAVGQSSPKKPEDFEQEKVLLGNIGVSIRAVYDSDNFYANVNVVMIQKINDLYNLKFITTILNSQLLDFYIKSKISNVSLNTNVLKQVPIPDVVLKAQQPFIQKADRMLALNKELQYKKTKFISRITSNLAITKTTRKISTFYNFDFKIFLAELKKQKVNLSLIQQDEWEDYFTIYKTEINQLQSEIEQTDKEIDKMVYKLYGLTEEEIGIVEQ